MPAVRWYPRFALSYRDVEELPAERGLEVDHVTRPLAGRAPGDRRKAETGNAHIPYRRPLP